MFRRQKATLMNTHNIDANGPAVTIEANADTTGWTTERFELFWSALGDLVNALHHPKWGPPPPPPVPGADDGAVARRSWTCGDATYVEDFALPDVHVHADGGTVNIFHESGEVAETIAEVRTSPTVHNLGGAAVPPDWAETIADARAAGEMDPEAIDRFGDGPEPDGSVDWTASTVAVQDDSSDFVVAPIGHEGSGVVVGAGSLLAAAAATAAHHEPDDSGNVPPVDTDNPTTGTVDVAAGQQPAPEPEPLPPVDDDLADMAMSPVDRLLKLVCVDDLFRDEAPLERHLANELDMRPPMVKQMLRDATEAGLITVTSEGRTIESIGITATGMARYNARVQA